MTHSCWASSTQQTHAEELIQPPDLEGGEECNRSESINLNKPGTLEFCRRGREGIKPRFLMGKNNCAVWGRVYKSSSQQTELFNYTHPPCPWQQPGQCSVPGAAGTPPCHAPLWIPAGKQGGSLSDKPGNQRCSALDLQEWTPFWWVLTPTSVTPLFLNPPPLATVRVHWNSSSCFSRKQPQCFQTRPVNQLQCLGACAYRAEILIQRWWLGLARLRLIWRG